MAYSYVTFGAKSPGDTIAVSFPFITRSHVTVQVDGVEVADTKWEWLSDGLISCLTGFPSGTTGKVLRTTPADALEGELVGTAVLDYPMVNANFDKTLYIIQEKADQEADRESRVSTLETSLSNQQGNLDASVELGRKWAEEVEDTEVTSGHYSSLHHATKSAASALLSQKWAEGTLPGGADTKSAKEWSDSASTSASEAAASAATIDLPAVTANTMLVDNAAGDARETKTFSEVRELLGLKRGAITPQGRLTLTTATPVTASDVAGATSIYYTPSGGAVVPLYDGSDWLQHEISEITLALDSASGHTGYHQSGKNFDLFVFNDSGTIRLGTGPAWSSDTARGAGASTTELASVNGLAVNAVSIAARFGSATGNTVTVAANRGLYVGSFRAVANGQTSDTKTKRFLFNAYNQAMRSMLVRDPANNWTYSTLAWRQANANTANQVEMLLGLAGVGVSAESTCIANSAPSGSWGMTGIGVDSTTELSADCMAGWAVAGSSYCGAMSKYRGFPGIGYHKLVNLEFGHGSGTSFLGDNSGTSIGRPGLSGEFYG